MSLVAVLIIAGPESDRPADAGFPFPPPPLFGVLLTVNTTVYPGFDDGFCSLDEAINAANINGIDDTCNASASEAGATDGIEFAIGAGNINVTSALPVITAPLAINGSVDTGGGAQITRVVLHGAGNNTGITVGGAAAAGSSIRNLVLNNFSTAIYLATTSNVTVAGNFIGTNAAGTGTVPNGVGISLSGASATIGGLNGLTPGGPCTGDCNLISGNSAGQARGIEMRNSSSATIRGNFIGTDAAGMFLFPNGVGVSLDRSRATIGGTAPGAGNVISGSASSAISIETDIDMAQGTVIQGNFIGTNVTGTAAVPNLGNGIYAYFGNQDYPLIIGGSGDGATNVISGNGAAGIYLTGADYVSIHGNLIGTQADGVSPLPNADAGVRLGSSTHSNLIGGISPGEGNVIAHNGADGVVVGINNYYNQVRGNSIHDNAGKGIYEPDNQADFTQIPTITGFGSVHGTACNNCIIDVYSDSADEGRIYEGTTTADGAGNWSYGGAMTGPNVTVTASSNESNPSQYSTSEFSAPMSVPTTPTPTPSPTSTPTPTPSATNAPTPTPTPIGGSPAPTPTPTPTPTGGPTGSPTPTPTGSPLTGALWGDDDCSVAVAATDSLKKLQDIAALPYQVEPGCPAFGDQVTVAPAGSIQVLWGDTDCDDDVDAVDALQILRQIAGLPPNQVQPCPEIGAPVLLG